MESNPYSPPQDQEESLAHSWEGRTVLVSSRFLRSYLWIIAGLKVEVDGLTVFSPVLWSFDNRWQFDFEHEGRRVPCRLRTRQALNTTLRLHYELSINDGPLVTRRVPIAGVIQNALAVAAVIIVLAMIGISGLAVYLIM